MFARFFRLTKEKDFDKIFNEGKKKYTKTIGILYLPNNLKNNRYGIIVSKKIAKKATTRNKIKRIIRSSLKKQEIFLKNGNDIIILAKPQSIDAKNDEIEENIDFCIKNIGLLK